MSNANGKNRISALKRLGKPFSINNINRRPATGSQSVSVNDARELLIPRNQSSLFNARPLSNTPNVGATNIIVRKNSLQNTARNNTDANGKMIVVTGLKDMKVKDGRLISTAATTDGIRSEKSKQIFAVGPATLVTIRNNNNNTTTNVSSNPPMEKISLTKTITNTGIRRDDNDARPQPTNISSALPNQKVVVRFVNDQYQKNPTPSPQVITMATNTTASSNRHRDSPPLIKRLHDVSIQTTPPPSPSRSPIRMSSHRRPPSTGELNEQDYRNNRTIDDDLYEPPVKRTSSTTRKTTTTTDKDQRFSSTIASTGSIKRTSTGVAVTPKPTSTVSTVSKPIATMESQSIPGIILVTNFVSSVTEEDVMELFGQLGRINQITTLSQGCVQIIYAKREHAEQAVAKYHNRLLDGQFMYVSLQQPSSNQTSKAVVSNVANQNLKSSNNIQQPTAKENGSSSNSSSITATNQPLKFNSTANTLSKISIDPTFIRQALFHPSNNTTNPVQFQVKL